MTTELVQYKPEKTRKVIYAVVVTLASIFFALAYIPSPTEGLSTLGLKLAYAFGRAIALWLFLYFIPILIAMAIRKAKSKKGTQTSKLSYGVIWTVFIILAITQLNTVLGSIDKDIKAKNKSSTTTVAQQH